MHTETFSCVFVLFTVLKGIENNQLRLYVHTVSFSLGFYIVLRLQGIRKQTKTLRKRHRVHIASLLETIQKRRETFPCVRGLRLIKEAWELLILFVSNGNLYLKIRNSRLKNDKAYISVKQEREPRLLKQIVFKMLVIYPRLNIAYEYEPLLALNFAGSPS